VIYVIHIAIFIRTCMILAWLSMPQCSDTSSFSVSCICGKTTYVS